MKRKFVKVMLFGALTLAVSTTVTSCKDYDDDVKNLQEQIDKINSSSPVSIEDMKTAIAAAKTELATEIDKLSKALDNKEASIETLKGEIETLKGKLNTAQGDAEAAKKLATELSSKQNELKTLVDANDKTLKELKASYDKLTGAEGDIRKLQQFVADYGQNKVISEHAKSDDLLAAFINSTIAEKLEGKDLVEYISTAVSTAIAQELVSVNQSITAITGKDGSLTKLQAQLNAALNGDEKNKGILDRLDELDETKKAIDAFLEKNPSQYADFEAVLNQIETLRSNYETMFTPSSLQGKVEQAINTALETTDFTFKQLVENVKQMGLDIEAIKAMVQSVVYVPKNTAGTEEFTTLYAKKKATDANYSIISRSEDLTVTFRVSPAKAALGFETGKYSLLMDAQEINTRSTSIFGVGEVTVEKEGGEPTGIVTIPLIATTASKDYALCLMVKDNSKEEVFTEVTSSYFPVLMTTKYLSPSYKVKYVSGETSRDIVYNETAATPLTFSKDGKVQAVFYDDKTTADADASTSYVDVPVGLKGVFTTTFALEGANKAYFDIDPATGKVTLNSTAFGQVGLVGQQVDVNAVTKITGVDAPVTTSLTTGGKVTITQKTENKEIAYSFEGTWKGNGVQTYTINMVDLYNKGAITEADYKALATSAFDVTGADNNVTFVRGNENALTITVPSATKVGTYNPTAVITVSSVKKITVKAAVTVKSLADVALTTVASPQKVDAGVDAAQASEIAVEVGDVSTLFPNYSDVYNKVVTDAGGTIEFAVTGIGTDFSANPKLTITKGYAAPVKVTATVKCGEKEDAVYTVTLVPDAKLSGTWTAPTKLTQKIASDKTSTVNLATGSVWKDYRGQKMWEAGTGVTGDGSNGFANSVDALDMYGLTAPTFKVVGDNADKFEVSAAGELSYSQAGKDMPSRDGLTATVEVTVKSKWGGAISSTGDVTTISVTVE
ncbi:MAG: hypothetical protein ACLU3W_15615 [Bacteroides ovatus]